jgi:hypothetical protein
MSPFDSLFPKPHHIHLISKQQQHLPMRQPCHNASNNSARRYSQNGNEPLEPPWRFDDSEYEDGFEVEAAERLSEYEVSRGELSRSYFRHHLFGYCPPFDSDDCHPKFRRSASVAFVISIVVLSAALIGLAIPSEGESDRMKHTTNDNSPANGEVVGEIVNIRSNSHRPDTIDDQTPQQLLLELAESISTACDPDTIRKAGKRKQCQMHCMDEMCCFDTGKYGCAKDEDKLCSVYAGCEVLLDPEWMTLAQGSGKSAFSAAAEAPSASAGGSLQLADEIIEYCDEYLDDPKSPGGEACIEYCKGHMCCFGGDGKAGKCEEEIKMDGYFSCEVYEGCEVVVGVEELERI